MDLSFRDLVDVGRIFPAKTSILRLDGLARGSRQEEEAGSN